MTEQTFTFKSGVTVALRRVNPVSVLKIVNAARDRHYAEYGEPQVPTWTVTQAGGTKEVNEHTEETVQLEPWKDDPEVQAAWDEYQTARTLWQAERLEVSTKAFCIKGVVDDPPDEWREEQAYWGVEVPEHPNDARWDWIQVISTGWDEMLELAFAVQGLPNKVEEAARAAEDSFRGSVESPDERPQPDGDQAEAEQGEA